MQRQFVNTILQRIDEISPLIQIVIGPRQVGKTTGIHQALQKYTAPYHFASADDELSAGKIWLTQQWQTAIERSEDCLLIIDEIQKIPNWAETIKKLWDNQQFKTHKIKVILAGSSSLALWKGATENLTGRFETISVTHWLYHESRELANLSIEQYLKFGGYPKSYDFIEDDSRFHSYLKLSIIDRVIEKDILQYSEVKNPSLFKQCFEILSCYPSQEISYRKLLGQLQDKGNTDLLKRYIGLYESAFLFKSIPKFGSQEFKIKTSSPKILPMAPCFYYAFAKEYEKRTFVFEAIVGIHLFHIVNELYYWHEDIYEVDFVFYFQGKLFALEVKSGQKKDSRGLEAFCKKYPTAITLFVSSDNIEVFCFDPKKWLEKFL